MRLQAAVGVRGAAEALQLAPRPGPRRQRVLLPQVWQGVVMYVTRLQVDTSVTMLTQV